MAFPCEAVASLSLEESTQVFFLRDLLLGKERMNQLKKGIPVDKVELESIEATPFFYCNKWEGLPGRLQGTCLVRLSHLTLHDPHLIHHIYLSQRMWSAVLSSSSRLLAAQQMRPLTAFVVRTYISRAHPKARTVFSIHSALDQVLQGIEERIHKRQAKWDRNAEERAAKGTKVSCSYSTETKPSTATRLSIAPRIAPSFSSDVIDLGSLEHGILRFRVLFDPLPRW